MFRMLKLNPPHGWRAVAWELAIVTLGVLIALATQQWAEARSWRAKASSAITPIRIELGDHYAHAVEWRLVHPCMIAQIERLQQRLANSGATLDPAPVYREPALGPYVLRLPRRQFIDSAWHAAIGDGVSPHFKPELRKGLSEHYNQAASLVVMTEQNARDNQRLFTLSRRVAIDPATTFSLMQDLDELRGRIDRMDLNSGQLLGQVAKLEMKPDPSAVGYILGRSGTMQLCVRERLPLRSLADASQPIDYDYSPKHTPVSVKP